MTNYAIDERNASLVGTWATGRGNLATTIAPLPPDATPEQCLQLAEDLSRLSQTLWRRYTHPTSADGPAQTGAETPAGEDTGNGFGEVIAAVEKPHVPDPTGGLLDSYDPIESAAHRVGRTLHGIGDENLRQAILTEVTTEIDAVEEATSGDLTGRAAQAAALTTADARPDHIAAAAAILSKNPLDATRLFVGIEPTAACVAAAGTLWAAVEITSELADIPEEEVLQKADDIEPIPLQLTTEVLDELRSSGSAHEVVTRLISETRHVADGLVPDPDQLQRTIDLATRQDSSEGTPSILLTPLDPQRPARDLLESLLDGIRGCLLLFGEYYEDDSANTADLDDETAAKAGEQRIRAVFCAAVVARADETPMELF